MIAFRSISPEQRETILRLAAKYGAQHVRIFGSVARGDDRPDSDIDLLVRWKPGTSLLDLTGLELDLEGALDRKVDVVGEGGISPYMKDRILAEAQPL